MKSYLNTTYANSVRHLGSNPQSPNTYTAATTSNMVHENTDTDDGDDYLIDVNAFKSGSMTLVTRHWLSSRNVAVSTSYTTFIARLLSASGSISINPLYGTNGSKDTTGYGLSPVVSLKSDLKITGGEGTESSPWILE